MPAIPSLRRLRALNRASAIEWARSRGRSGAARFRRADRLVLAGVATLLVSAAVLSSLPVVQAPGSEPQYEARYGAADQGRSDETGDITADPSGAQDGSEIDFDASLPPNLYIDNAFQNPPATIVPRDGFVWYVVKSGDSLRNIAARFGLKTASVYAANKKSLPDPESIKSGLRLLIPPIDGLTVTVAEGDSISSLALKYKVTGLQIVEANRLSANEIAVGQYLVIPVDPGPVPGGASGTKYLGGNMRWPVVGGDNHITQYFSRSHRALDIGAKYGTPIIAAAGGVVVYAGWRSYTQGGYVVWIKHANGMYTTYNHLSRVYARRGTTVAAGKRIGLVGSSGNSTGPHLHFEVWIGYPWSSGSYAATNPCRVLSEC